MVASVLYCNIPNLETPLRSLPPQTGKPVPPCLPDLHNSLRHYSR